MTTTQPPKIRAGYEPIPGYVLEEVIGRGGFGEVWRASAPGGLKKAVKFVFGTQDQSRGARELRSLERIKGVQHPFLLTLERFEAIDDQLVIVTELADCSLEDVFKRNRDRGSCGVPRESLISHLRDACDALDYLHQRYQLQHLDIKPGNLLLVGGHVKVADFGLLKDLREVDCSIVGGLTPIYAPPEIFDGRPSMHSDQYSLAVMYQELLTGTRPFAGRTIAQLATQHVHSAPNLEPLPPSDRPVVARALEKNPERRFPNCTAFVDALRSSHGRSLRPGHDVDDLAADNANVTADGFPGAQPIEDLPQLTTGAPAVRNKAQYHAMVIALGGTGARCLRELRRRVADMHSASPLDLHSVLIDTDQETTYSMRVGEVSERTPKCKVIYTPLRKAQEYRQDGTERLRTISRRWIYNVPRSGATEGMRPLGRLALVDHGVVVTDRLKEAIHELAASAGNDTPKVYVVGSINGGTASGMYIDVVHLLRHLLDEAGMVETPILSMLSTAAMQGDPSHPLALHDAHAALKEMCHFLQAGNGYPGDAGAGWPSVPAARTPLTDVYVVAGSTHGHLTPPPPQTITDYIWTDATGAGELLAEARKSMMKKETSIVPPSIRSVGVVTLGRSDHLERKVLAPTVVRELLIEWLGLPNKARQAASPLADRIARRAGFSADAILRETVNRLAFKAKQNEEPDAGDPTLVADLISGLHREISVALNDRRVDVTTVIESLKLIREKLSAALSELPQQVSQTPQSPSPKQTSSPACLAPNHLAGTTAHAAANQMEQICIRLQSLQERLDRFATMLAMSIVAASKSQPGNSNPWDEMPAKLQSKLPSLVAQLHSSAVNRFLVRPITAPGESVGAETMVSQLVDATVPMVAAIIDENRELLSEADQGEGQNDEEVTVLSPPELQADANTQTALTRNLQPSQAANDAANPLSVEEALVAVKPALLAFGGLQRLMLVVGSEQERERLESQVRESHEGPLNVAVVPGSTPKLIHEAQQVDLTNILSRLTVLNGGNAQVTGRLSSRTDLTW